MMAARALPPETPTFPQSGEGASRSPCHLLIVDPQHEKVAASHLTGTGVSCYLPTEPAYRTRSRRRKPVKIRVPIFHGYLFVATSNNYSISMRDTVFGLRRLAQRNGKPLVLSIRAMAVIREIERKLQTPETPFKPGDRVRVMSGVLADQLSQVDTCDHDDLTILVEMLGRKVRTRLNVFDVELVSRG